MKAFELIGSMISDRLSQYITQSEPIYDGKFFTGYSIRLL